MNKNIPVYGKGRNQREWIYVKDHCRALIKIYKKGIREILKINGKESIIRCIENIKQTAGVHKTIVCTTTNPEDNESFFDPADDKIYRYPTFFKVSKKVKDL